MLLEWPPPAARAWVRAVLRPVGAAGTAIALWSRRPSGRLVVSGAVIAALIATAGTAGAWLVPATAEPLPAAAASASAGPTADPEVPSTPGFDPPVPPVDPDPPPSEGPQLGREADKLATWAAPIATRTGIPVIALQAYGYAEWVLSQERPMCRLTWPTLAAIGKVESNHGRGAGASLGTDGRALPPIIGLPLDGQGGRRLISDSDRGSLDNDGVYDRALGPMQFLPQTWRSVEVDADNDGVRDVHDIDDAALAAARYLCFGSRDMTTAAGWRESVLSYNRVESYVRTVLTEANAYATRSSNSP